VPDPVKHICTNFDAALYELKGDVLMMSSLADRLFQSAFEALLTRNSELCDYVIVDDDEIDILEKQIDQEAVTLLIRFHPLATDMRDVVSTMKVSTNLERIGDQSVTIARRAKRLNDGPLLSEISLLEPLFQNAIAIFRDSIRAFADGDFELARTLKPRDKELDALTTDVDQRLAVRATANPEFVQSYLDLIFVSRALERVGDHATNIAEDSFWRDQAADIRHAR
jgi:phosphate transport system protein